MTLSFDPTPDPPETEHTFSVPVINDDLNEANETFKVTLSNPANAVFQGDEMSITATGTILNDLIDDPLPTLRFTNTSPTATGCEPPATDDCPATVDFVVELDAESGQTVMVNYRTRDDGSATEGEDYTETSGTLTFPPGETRMTIQVPVKEDNIDEGDESFMLDLSVNSQSNAQLDADKRTATGTITDNDPVPTGIKLTVNPSTISEGAGSQTVSVTATFLGDSVRATGTTVSVTVSGSVSGRVGYAVNRSMFQLQIQAGSRSGTASFTLTPTNNNLAEMPATVTVSGTADIDVTSTTITLTDNDGAPDGVTLSVRPTSIREGEPATTVTVTAWLDGDGSELADDAVVTVTVSREDDTELPEFDFPLTPFDLTIPKNSQSGTETFILTPNDDEVAGPDATVTVSGRSLVGPVSPATLMVTDNDSPSTQVTLSVNPNLVSEDDGRTEIDVTATLNRSARTVPTVVNVQVSGSGRANVVGFEGVTPFSITIPAKSKEATESFDLKPVNNDTRESSETVTLSGYTTVPELNVLDTTLVLNDDDGGTPGTRPPGPRPPGPGPQPPGGNGTVTIIPDSDVVPGDGDDSGLGISARAVALSTPLAPTPAKIVIWTDQNEYQPGNELMLYRTMDPMGDENQYTLFFYRENIETGERRYFAGGAGSTALSEDVVDHYNMSDPAFRIAPIEQVEQQSIWSGFVPGPGLWHFVAELRSPDTTQVLKRAHAKFVVARNTPMMLGEGGSETEIATDTTWVNDTIYKLRGGSHREVRGDVDNRAGNGDPGHGCRRRDHRRERRPDRRARTSGGASGDHLRRKRRGAGIGLLGRSDRPRQCPGRQRRGNHERHDVGDGTVVRRGRSRRFERRAAVCPRRIRRRLLRRGESACIHRLSRSRIWHGDRPRPSARGLRRRHCVSRRYCALRLLRVERVAARLSGLGRGVARHDAARVHPAGTARRARYRGD